jgi:hypothetical protein
MLAMTSRSEVVGEPLPRVAQEVDVDVPRG